METPTLSPGLSTEGTLRNPSATATESVSSLEALRTTTDELRAMLETQGRQLNELFDLLRLSPPRPRSRASSTRGGAKVWCPCCQTACPSDAPACPGCGAALRDLASLAKESLAILLPSTDGRFAAKGWEMVGQSPVECPGCLETLHCAIKIHESGGTLQRYWALLCPRCATIAQLSALRRDQKESLNAWARESLSPRDESSPPVLSATLAATWSALSSGLRPDQVAEQRGLAVATIYGHLGLLVQLGHCALEDLVSPEIVDAVIAAHARYPRPVDLADLESRLPLPLLRQDVLLVTQAKRLEMGLGDSVDDESRPRVREALLAAVKEYPERLSGRDAVGICLGTESFRTGQFANRTLFGSLRGFAAAALSAELRAMAREGGLIGLTPAKKLTLKG